jgi:hypothetical protein
VIGDAGEYFAGIDYLLFDDGIVVGPPTMWGTPERVEKMLEAFD